MRAVTVVFLFAMFVLVVVAPTAWSQSHIWSQRFGSTGTDVAHDITEDSAGNILVVGTFTGTVDFGGGPLVASGNVDMFVAKYDAIGTHLWSKRFGGPSSIVPSDQARKVAVDSADNVVVTGLFGITVDFGGGALVSAGGNYDIFVAKFDSNGNHLWSKGFGSSGLDQGNGIGVDGADNVFVAGDFMNTVNFGGGPLTSTGGKDVFVLKFDPNGTHLWSRAGGGPSAGGEQGVDLAVDGAGNALVTGFFTGTANYGGVTLVSAGSLDIFVAKYNSSGAHVWSQRLGGTGDDQGRNISADGAGNVLIGGHFSGTANFGGTPLVSAGARDLLMAKFDASGAHVWSQGFGSTGNDFGGFVEVDNGDNVLFVGEFTGTVDFGGGPLTSAGSLDMIVARYDPTGAHIWSQRLGGTGSDQGTGSPAGVTNSVMVVGTFNNTVDFGGGPVNSAGGFDAFVAKYSSTTGGSGSAQGTVVADCPNPGTLLAGVTVDAFNALGDLVASDDTDGTGAYDIPGLPVGSYTISVVIPLGYTAAIDEIVVNVVDGVASIADFSLTCPNIVPNTRAGGFWKHQVAVAAGGNGNADIDAATLCAYLDEIESHFANNTLNSVAIYTIAPTEDCSTKLAEASSLLNLKGQQTHLARAKQRLMSLLLNVASGGIALTEPISVDGATVSQAITYCDNLIDDPGGDHVLAKTIANNINAGATVAAGLIPLTTEEIAYAPGRPDNASPKLSLGQNYPNPFNPTTMVYFSIDREQHVSLSVYDISGRLVRTLVDRGLSAGEHAEEWDARDNSGNSVATGVYFYRLTAGSRTFTRKAVLLK